MEVFLSVVGFGLRLADEMRSPASSDAGLMGRWDAVVRCCPNAATRHRTGENKLLPSLYYSAKTTPIADKPCSRNRITESGQVSGETPLSADKSPANLSRVSCAAGPASRAACSLASWATVAGRPNQPRCPLAHPRKTSIIPA